MLVPKFKPIFLTVDKRFCMFRAAKKANNTQKVTPHVLRHCFATHLHDGGVSIKLVQELLGHKDVKTTMIYTPISTQTITAIKSPLDALGKKHNSDTDL